MPCSNCKQNGHNRSTCINAPPPPPPPKEEPQPVIIIIPEEDKIKLRKLVAICTEVATTLGKGYPESVYQHALCKELQLRGIRYGHEVPMPIMYKGEAIPYNTQRLDIILYDYLPFIFELKATSSHIKSDEKWQLVRYMVTQKKSYGAVVNFSQTLSGPMEFSFIVHHEGQYKVYDIESSSVKSLVDYGYMGDL